MLTVNLRDGGETAEILLYDVIGGDFFGEGTTSKRFAAELKAIQAKRINLRINSPGGSAFEGFAIYEQLRRHKAEIAVSVDGLAASAASVVAMAGDTISMAANAMMMIHSAWSLVGGNATELRQQAELLDKLDGQIIETYVARSKGDAKQFEKWVKAETWFSADEAKAAGLADEIGDYNRAAASVLKPNWLRIPAAAAQRLATVPGPTEQELQAHERRRAAVAALGG